MIYTSENNKQWEDYLQYGKRIFVKKGSTLYKKGDSGNGFYYLTKGSIKVIVTTSKEKEEVVNIVLPGQLAGVHSMDQEEHFTTAIALTDSVVYFFAQEHVYELMKIHKDLVTLLTETLIGKLRILIEQVDFNSLSAEQQLYKLFTNLCLIQMSDEIHITQQEIVNYTGLNRSTIYRISKKWEREKLIEIKKNLYILKQGFFGVDFESLQ